MNPVTPVSSRAQALLRSRVGIRFSRYTVASVVAVVVSQIVFMVAYGPLDTSSGVAIVAGFMSGLVPKYTLCRNWAWKRRGRSRIGREVFPYVAVSVLGAVFAYYLTEFLEDYIRRVADGQLQVILMGAAFLVSQGLFFIVKFVLFDQMVFNGGGRQPDPPGQAQQQPSEP